MAVKKKEIKKLVLSEELVHAAFSKKNETLFKKFCNELKNPIFAAYLTWKSENVTINYIM